MPPLTWVRSASTYMIPTTTTTTPREGEGDDAAMDTVFQPGKMRKRRSSVFLDGRKEHRDPHELAWQVNQVKTSPQGNSCTNNMEKRVYIPLIATTSLWRSWWSTMLCLMHTIVAAFMWTQREALFGLLEKWSSVLPPPSHTYIDLIPRTISVFTLCS